MTRFNFSKAGNFLKSKWSFSPDFFHWKHDITWRILYFRRKWNSWIFYKSLKLWSHDYRFKNIEIFYSSQYCLPITVKITLIWASLRRISERLNCDASWRSRSTRKLGFRNRAEVNWTFWTMGISTCDMLPSATIDVYRANGIEYTLKVLELYH